MSYLSTTIKRTRYLVTRDNDHVLILEKNDGAFIDLVLDTADSRDAAITIAINDLLAGVPDALNTLNELAAAIGDDANFAASVTAALGDRLQKSLNLSDLPSVLTARANLGLGSAALHADTDFDTPIARATAIASVASDRVVTNPGDGSGGVNVKEGSAANSIATGIGVGHANTVGAGGTTGSGHRLLTIGPSYNSVGGAGGGYDCVIEADVTGVGMNGIHGAHHRVTGAVTHGHIGWGSFSILYAGDYGNVSGGTAHDLGATGGTIGGGQSNRILPSATNGTIPGGNGVIVSGSGALAAGTRSVATGNGSFIGSGSDNWVFSGSAFIGGGQSNQIGDGVVVTDGVITGGALNTLACTTSTPFTAGMVGRAVYVVGAGKAPASTTTGGVASRGVTLVTTIAAFTDSGHVTLTDAAIIAVAGATVVIVGTATTAAWGLYGGIDTGLSNLLGTNASAQYGKIGGGRLNQVQADYGAVPGGRENQVTGQNGHASGYGAVADKYGQQSRASGYFAIAGDAQSSRLMMRRSTTDATQTELRLDGSGQRLVLSDTSTYRFKICVVGRRTDTRSPAQDIAWEFAGIATRESGAATVTYTSTSESTLNPSALPWTLTVTADTTNGAVSVKVTGEAAKTIRWLADVELVKVSG